MQQTYNKLVQQLLVLYPENEAKAFSLQLMAQVIGMRPAFLFMEPNEPDSAQQAQLQHYLQQALEHRPLEYILGKASFFGLEFFVGPGSLIPRPETEELVDWVLQSKLPTDARILDVGTGSGCIAISLAHEMPNAEVTAIDFSDDALRWATKNALRLAPHVHVQKANIFELKPGAATYDCIVSNPPYVLESEKELMRANVLNHEPHTALFVKDTEALIFFETIGAFARHSLSSGGFLFFEINEAFGLQTVQMLEKQGFRTVELRKDLSGRDRMIRAQL